MVVKGARKEWRWPGADPCGEHAANMPHISDQAKLHRKLSLKPERQGLRAEVYQLAPVAYYCPLCFLRMKTQGSCGNNTRS